VRPKASIPCVGPALGARCGPLVLSRAIRTWRRLRGLRLCFASAVGLMRNASRRILEESLGMVTMTTQCERASRPDIANTYGRCGIDGAQVMDVIAAIMTPEDLSPTSWRDAFTPKASTSRTESHLMRASPERPGGEKHSGYIVSPAFQGRAGLNVTARLMRRYRGTRSSVSRDRR